MHHIELSNGYSTLSLKSQSGKGTYTYYVITFEAFLDPLPPSIIKGYHLADPPPANDNIILGQFLLVKYSDASQELVL